MSRFAGLLAVLLAFGIAGAASSTDSDASLDQPPPGLTPTSARLADILKAHAHAIGSRTPGTPDSVIEHWAVVDSGMSGSEDLQRSGTDYRSRVVSGPFVDEYGQHGSIRWHEDANGFGGVTTATDSASFYATRVLEDASDPKNDAKVLGETTSAYVVQVNLPGNTHPEYFFFDKTSAQIVRVELVVDKRRLVETYSDFRESGGVTRPWHVHDTDGRAAIDDDWTLQSLQSGIAIADQTFVMPPNRPTVTGATAAMPLPARETWLDLGILGHMWTGFVVRLNVAGRGLDFLLDSSDDESVIDWDVAQELGLPAYGQNTRLADGTPIPYRTELAHANIGGINLNNFVVVAKKFSYEPNNATRVVGVLGYDFFAANVVHLDFANGTVEVLPVSEFAGAAPVKGGIEVPISINDGTPLVSVGIGNEVASNAVLSTTMPFTMIFGTFVAAHPEEAKDASPKSHSQGVVPFADSDTYGLKVEHWTSTLSHFRFAVSDLQQTGVEATNMPFSLHGEPIDALVGADQLHYYDLYFDYPYGRLIVKPNAIFFATFKKGG